MNKLKTLQCITCHAQFQTRQGKTGKCYRCSRSNPKSTEAREKIRSARLWDKNPGWKGDNVGYKALHTWVRRYLPKPELCQKCGLVPPLDLANKGIYDRNFDNWEYLCRKCHIHSDGRLDRLHESNRKHIL